MKPWRYTFLVIIVVLTILSLLLSACGPVEKSHGNSGDGKDKDKDKIKEKDNGTDKAKDKEKDKDQDKGGNANKILICHKTGSPKKPYVQISVANDAVKDGHAGHPGDIIPAPQAGCPTK